MLATFSRPSESSVKPISQFPIYCMPQFQSESWCTTIQMACVFLCKSNSFPFQHLSTKTQDNDPLKAMRSSKTNLGILSTLDREYL